jgi:hypothetical protein
VEVVAPLGRALAEEDDALVVSAAQALGAIGDPAAEPPLIAALDREGPAVWPAIAEALGKVGTATAVAPLREMAGRFPFDLGLRRASRQAIAEIQSRLTGATPGQLALADGGSGQLSLADEGVEGRVSMAAEAEEATTADDQTQWPTDKADEESPSPAPSEESAASSAPAPTRHRDTE